MREGKPGDLPYKPAVPLLLECFNGCDATLQIDAGDWTRALASDRTDGPIDALTSVAQALGWAMSECGVRVGTPSGGTEETRVYVPVCGVCKSAIQSGGNPQKKKRTRFTGNRAQRRGKGRPG